MVRVRVYAQLREKLGWSVRELKIEGTVSLKNVLESIVELRPLIPLFENGDLMILVNGVNARLIGGLDTRISDEDVLDIFPPGGGG